MGPVWPGVGQDVHVLGDNVTAFVDAGLVSDGLWMAGAA